MRQMEIKKLKSSLKIITRSQCFCEIQNIDKSFWY